MAVFLSLFAGAGQQFFTNAGVPLAGGKIYTYGAGGSTPQATYTTSAGNIAHSNPIQLDAAGRVPSGGEIWLTSNLAYKFQIETSAGAIIQTLDNIGGGVDGATLAGSGGSALIGFIQAGSGAVARTVQSKLRDTVSVKDFGAVGDGVTNDTTAIQAALNATAAANQRLIITSGSFSVTGVSAPANTDILFDGGKLVARNTTTVLTIAGNDVTIENPVIDLDSKSPRGIFALSVDGFRLLGTTRISNAKTGEANYNGAAQIESCTNTVVEDVIGENIRQSATLAGLYRVLEFNLCTDFSAGKVFANNCDIALNLPDSVNGFVEAVQGNDITDNVVYLLGASRNISIGNVHGYICGEGIVFNCTDIDAGIHIGSVFINSASAKGLSLRTGGGYHLGSVTLIEANMEQVTSFSPATSRMTIGSLKIYQNTATAFKPINLFGNTHITFGTIDIQANAPLNLEGARFTDCDRIIVGSARVWGIGGTALTIGLRFSDGGAPVANPYFFIQDYSAQNVTVPYSIGTATKTNIRILSDGTLFSNLTMQQFGGVTLQLENLNNTLTAGNVLALFQAYSNDASSPGVKFKLEVQAAGGNGGLGQTLLKNDADAVVGRLPPDSVNAGMSIKLPTSSSGLDSGMIWNNAGVVAIVP